MFCGWPQTPNLGTSKPWFGGCEADDFFSKFSNFSDFCKGWKVDVDNSDFSDERSDDKWCNPDVKIHKTSEMLQNKMMILQVDVIKNIFLWEKVMTNGW